MTKIDSNYRYYLRFKHHYRILFAVPYFLTCLLAIELLVKVCMKSEYGLCTIGNIFEDTKYIKLHKVLCLKPCRATLPVLHEVEKLQCWIRWKAYHHIVNNEFPICALLGLM